METTQTPLQRTKVSVVTGNPAKFKTKALIAPLGALGTSTDPTGQAIRAVGGQGFYRALILKGLSRPFGNGEAVLNPGGGVSHNGGFENLIFVADGLRGTADSLVYEGLKKAAEAELREVAVAPFRLGLLSGEVEELKVKLAIELSGGVFNFLSDFPGKLDSVTFVIQEEGLPVVVMDEDYSDEFRSRFSTILRMLVGPN